jgi:hypothetical protein
VNKIATSK